MQNRSFDTPSLFADAAESDLTEPWTATPDEDPAGGIALTGRGRMGARARALAGIALTSGLVAAMIASDTSSSVNHIGIL